MFNRFRSFILSAVALACGASPIWAAGGDHPSRMLGGGPPWEAGIQYSFVHTNAPPGGCGCFSMNGGAATLGFDLSENWVAVGEFAAQHASNVDGSGLNLTLTSYLAGPRYQIRSSNRVRPFAQILLGMAHASGSYAPGTIGYPGAPNAFAMTAGGGLDVFVTEKVGLRLPQVDYYLTNFDNAVNKHQNNLRVSAGITFRFGRR
jgi:outer membrane immunogenic protein